MKQGKSLSELATEIERQQNAKRDFVADTRKITMSADSDNGVHIQLPDQNVRFTPTRIAHGQIAQWAHIPQPYYDRMPADLRSVNVNYWLNKEPAMRMVRTLDGNARAFMSHKYRALDNYDLANAVLPILAEVPDMRVESCELTERRMYIKALFPRIESEISVGDVVQSGVVISNSEVGQGSLRVEPLVFRLECKNGLISNFSQKKYHIGKGHGEEESAMEIFRDETIIANDRAFWMKVQDTVRASVQQASFQKIVDEMKRTKEMPITDNPVEVVERIQKKFAMNETEGGNILQHLIRGGDLSAYGLLNAITRTAQDVECYDRATELERTGGKVIELSRTEWKNLAMAA